MNKRDVLLLSMYALLWGIWVSNPFCNTFDGSALYSSMAYIFPEWVWGCTALFIGVMSVFCVLNNRLRCLCYLSKAGALLWGFIAILYITTDISSTGWITAFVISSFYSLKTLNLSINKEKAFNE
jgi:hypothetical protein